LIYHALNRANARLTIFADEGDYLDFERIPAEAIALQKMRLLGYCLMPNHFHLLLWPHVDCDLARFMRRLTRTHAQRWHAHRHSAGSRHPRQGRFMPFTVQGDEQLYTVCCDVGLPHE
jgi:putative transposase